jgi:lanosterol synthase
MQNSDGGYASYERVRGSQLLEKINPAEIFDRIMVEYSYPECTTAVLTSLSLFHRHFPDYRPDDIKQVISRAAEYIRHSQRTDGSWYGSWAICFTYATFFALESLELVGETFQTSERVRRACKWLVGKQMEDGGWGEHYTSCEKWEYIQHEKSQIVNTCWAVLGLMHARYPDRTVVEKGLKVRACLSDSDMMPLVLSLTAKGQLILSRQQATGEWLQEGIEGVFNGTW